MDYGLLGVIIGLIGLFIGGVFIIRIYNNKNKIEVKQKIKTNNGINIGNISK